MVDPEDRVRDALGAYADQIEPSTDAWASVDGRLGGTSPRWWRSPRALGPIAVLAAAALVAAFFVLRDDGEQAQQVDIGDGGAAEVERPIIAVTDDNRLIEMNQQGEEVREILDLAVIDGGRPVADLEVSRDGETVFLQLEDSYSPPDVCEAQYRERVTADPAAAHGGIQTWVVELADGTYRPASEAQTVAVAPGSSEDDLGVLRVDPCDGSTEVAVDAGYVQTDATSSGAMLSADSTPLAVEWVGTDQLAVLDLGRPPYGSAVVWRMFDTATWAEVEVHAVDLAPDFLGALGTAPGGGTFLGSSFGPSPWQVSYQGLGESAFRELFTISGEEGAPSSYQFSADGSPGRVLVATRGSALDGSNDVINSLYLWDGSGEPRRIAEGIVAAAWGGSQPSTEPDTTDDRDASATTAPPAVTPTSVAGPGPPSGRILTLSAVGDLTESNVNGGAPIELGRIELPPGGLSPVPRPMAVSPNGSDLFVAVVPDDDVCEGEIWKFLVGDLAAGHDVVEEDATSPMVSPDGELLAFLSHPRLSEEDPCEAALAVRELATDGLLTWLDGEDPLDVATKVPLLWEPDSETVIMQITYTSDNTTARRYQIGPPCELPRVDDSLCAAGGPVGQILVPNPMTEWSVVGWLLDESLVVRANCYPQCAEEALVAAVDWAETDSDSSDITQELAEIPATATDVSVDGEGRLLYVLDGSATMQPPSASGIGAVAIESTAGIVAAVWFP